MNLLSEIISNAMDLAGGTSLNLKANSATLLAMNAVADMELELAGSSRGRQAVKVLRTFDSTLRTGTLPMLPAYIRLRIGDSGFWQIIDIVSDIEDLTIAENENRRAIMFYGGNPYTYLLSFDAPANNVCELWGANLASEPTTLSAPISIPTAYAHLAANRTAILLLDEVMLDPNAAALMPFFQSRKASLMARQRDLNHRWTVYRSNADNSLGDGITRPYNPFAPDEYGTVFSNGNSGGY